MEQAALCIVARNPNPPSTTEFADVVERQGDTLLVSRAPEAERAWSYRGKPRVVTLHHRRRPRAYDALL